MSPSPQQRLLPPGEPPHLRPHQTAGGGDDEEINWDRVIKEYSTSVGNLWNFNPSSEPFGESEMAPEFF